MIDAKHKSASGRSRLGYRKAILLWLGTLFLIAALCVQLPVRAADKSANVSLQDLDVSTTAGLQTARDRLHQTARWLCGRVVDPWSVSRQPDFVRCVDEATAGALAQLQSKLLAAGGKRHAEFVSKR
jgi:UrcA family protein